MKPHSDFNPHQAQRLLADGRPGGPEQDAMWARLNDSLDAAEQQDARAQRRRWNQRLLWLLPALAAPAAIAFAVLSTSDSDLTARGTPQASSVSVVASCGTLSAPCHVGEKVYFSLQAGEVPMTVEVRLARPKTLLFKEQLRPMESRAATVALTPEATDVATGITLDIGDLKGRQRLHLEVRP